jgi:hypothetical protein
VRESIVCPRADVRIVSASICAAKVGTGATLMQRSTAHQRRGLDETHGHE